MTVAKFAREKKRQLGQFLTPDSVARRLVDRLELDAASRVLEPSFGEGAFLVPLIERFWDMTPGASQSRLDRILDVNVFGVEIDRTLHRRCLTRIAARFGAKPRGNNLHRGDFFAWFPGSRPGVPKPPAYARKPRACFDAIVGNPPFGGSIDARHQDDLDAVFGRRAGENVKKETYSFFVVKSIDLLARGGRLLFICSDTFLTINTMRGLRRFLLEMGDARVDRLDEFSRETTHPMVVLDHRKTERPATALQVGDVRIAREQLERTANFSWGLRAEHAKYFGGPLLGEFLVATGGMTIGNNELFVREIVDGSIVEPYRFEFFDEPITLERELARARLSAISQRKREKITAAQDAGERRRNVRVVPHERPFRIDLPHPDYALYNKATSGIVFAPPRHAIFWKDDGDAVLTFKRNGNWYLHGVGGRPFFGRSGITWNLISSRIHARFLPEGYILDSGAPCAFLREGVAHDELSFVMAWLLTPLANRILKTAINHTRNIQGKDVERLPYPSWVSATRKAEIIARIRDLVHRAMQGETFDWQSPEIARLDEAFRWAERSAHADPPTS